MIDNINAAPDYGDEPPFACSSVAVLDGQGFACAGTPGHAGKHSYLIWWEGQGDITAKPEPQRYALVEQMGFRRTYGTVRETEFCGRPMLEVTSLETGAVHLAAPESLYQVTWLTRAQAEAATRTGSHSPAALSAAIAGDLASWGDGDEYGDGDAEETAAILADPAAMAAIAEGEADL